MHRSHAHVWRGAVLAISVGVVMGCGAATPATSSPASASTGVTPSIVATATAAPVPSPTFESAWAADLDRLDTFVRARHVSPFTIHSEAEWTAKLAEVRAAAPKAANADERVVLLASLVSLLDSHSWYWRDSFFHPYPVQFYKFTEGWFVTAAVDPTLVGAKLVSIGGHSAADVEATFRRLVPYDNESGFLLNGQIILSFSEFLHGAGIVADVAHPQFVFSLPNGKEETRDFDTLDEAQLGDQLHLVHSLVGKAPESVARNAELNWWRIEKGKVFHLAVNDYGDEGPAIAALKDAFDTGKADRVVLDIRFLPGGNGDFAVLDTLKNDPRINKPGGLTVLIGRENFSVATLFVRIFDLETNALLVGEPTPARADNFRCDCAEINLPAFDMNVQVPTYWDHIGDDRPEIKPDVSMPWTAGDFFAGKDPALDAALRGIAAP